MVSEEISPPHRGRVTHICVRILSIIGSDNVCWHAAFIWTNAGSSPVTPGGLQWILNQNTAIFVKNRRLFDLGLDVWTMLFYRILKYLNNVVSVDCLSLIGNRSSTDKMSIKPVKHTLAETFMESFLRKNLPFVIKDCSSTEVDQWPKVRQNENIFVSLKGPTG